MLVKKQELFLYKNIVMKKLLFALLILVSFQSYSQCWSGLTPFKSGYKPDITAAVVIDKSMRYYQSGFAGTGIHAGIWIDWLGFTVGGVESKMGIQSATTRDIVFTMLGRYWLLDDKIQVNPFFAVGSNNFQDVGIRAGYEIGDGIYLGGVFSRSMKYGINISVSINHQSK